MIVTALSELLIDMNYIFVFHIFMMRYWIYGAQNETYIED